MFTKSDYTKITLDAEETEYVIGTDFGEHFHAEETLLLSTVEAFFRLDDDELWQKIYGDEYFIIKRKIFRIFVKSSYVGSIEIWSEGN